MLCKVILGDQSGKDGLGRVVFRQVRHAALLNVFAGVAGQGHFDCLVLEHIDVTHVPLLQLLLSLLDLVVVVLLQLLALQPAGQDCLRARVLLGSAPLLLDLVFHGRLLLRLVILHVVLSQLDFELLLLSGPEQPVLDVELFLLLEDLGLLEEESLPGLLQLLVKLHGDSSLLLVDLTLLLLHLHARLLLHLVDLSPDLLGEQGCLLPHRLAVVVLHVAEGCLRADGHSSDLDSLEPDAPPLDHIEHFFVDGVAEELAIGDHFEDGRVCNAAADDTCRLGHERVVSSARVA